MRNFSRGKNKLRYAYLRSPVGLTEKSGLATELLKLNIAGYEAVREEIKVLGVEMDTVKGGPQ